jgi:hypothetical protein
MHANAHIQQQGGGHTRSIRGAGSSSIFGAELLVGLTGGALAGWIMASEQLCHHSSSPSPLSRGFPSLVNVSSW